MQTEIQQDTPLMRQYQALKASYPHAILFFRLGDFYEMFGDDAKTVSSLLGLVLTARHGVPMCGVPAHSGSTYISRLLKAGMKIAICEQTGQGGPDEKSRLFKRQVVRLITPGTVFEDELLDAKTANYLVCVETDIVGWGIACVEVSTCEFWATQMLGASGIRQLSAILAKLDPAEVLVSGGNSADEIKNLNILSQRAVITAYSKNFNNPAVPSGWADVNIWENHKLALKAAMRAAAYIEENEPHLRGMLMPSFREPSDYLQMDEAAVRTLELVGSGQGNRQQTLWGTLDNTNTSMGSRLLKRWILQPLTDIDAITRRQNCVQELVEDARARESACEILAGISDIERAMSRVAAGSAGPRDVSAVGRSLRQVLPLKAWLEQPDLQSAMAHITAKFLPAADELENARQTLERAMEENPPAKISDGGVIREGYNGQLDELRALRKNSRGVLLSIESREKERAHIPSLKIGYNSVFGYYLEVTKSHLAKVPADYIRKQTLVNAERFITQELKEMESKIMGAEDRILKLETHLFSELKVNLLKSLKSIRLFAGSAAELDVLYSLAATAVRGEYERPVVDVGNDIVFEDARHPVVEKFLPAGSFVPNSLKLGSGDPQIIVLTGPNMSGKSVYLRQCAVIVIMAQMGSFVPAKSARIGLVDRIMTRIGAQDAVARGESTFMVEMKETASILSSLTPRSLLLLDEIGRGTSTFDGISIAWAVIEYLYKPENGPKALFATHYFELTELADRFPGIKNFNVEAREWTNASGRTEVVFLHKISQGPADKSYGIHVAELAGLPVSCISRARKILSTLERKTEFERRGADKTEQDGAPLLPLFSSHPVLDEIRVSVPEKMTPLEALDKIAKWKNSLE